MDLSKYRSRCSKFFFFFQNGQQSPGQGPRRTSAKFQPVRVPHVSGTPSPCSPCQDAQAGGAPPGTDPGTAPTRGQAIPPSLAHPTAAGANAYRARRWAGPRGTRTAAPPQHRGGGVSARRSPQGRRPVRCSKPRGGGGGLASMARRSSGERTGREAAMAAWSRGPCARCPRGSLSAPRSPQPHSRRGLGCKALRHWPLRDGRWFADAGRASPPPRAPPLRAGLRRGVPQEPRGSLGED